MRVGATACGLWACEAGTTGSSHPFLFWTDVKFNTSSRACTDTRRAGARCGGSGSRAMAVRQAAMRLWTATVSLGVAPKRSVITMSLNSSTVLGREIPWSCGQTGGNIALGISSGHSTSPCSPSSKNKLRSVDVESGDAAHDRGGGIPGQSERGGQAVAPRAASSESEEASLIASA